MLCGGYRLFADGSAVPIGETATTYSIVACETARRLTLWHCPVCSCFSPLFAAQVLYIVYFTALRLRPRPAGSCTALRFTGHWAHLRLRGESSDRV